jgi:hypothetical protein
MHALCPARAQRGRPSCSAHPSFPKPKPLQPASPRHRAGATSDADISTFRGAPRRNTRRAAFIGRAKAAQRLWCKSKNPAVSGVLRHLHEALIDVVGFLNRPQNDIVLLREAGVSLDRALFPPLGPVDKPDPESNAAEQDEAEKTAVGLVISGGDPALFLEMADKAFDA